MQKKKYVILSVINDINGDQRLHRIASTLVEAGFELEIVGRKLPNSLPLADRPYKMHRMRLLFKKGKLFYLEYNLRLFFLLLFRRVDILTANDLDTLLPNYLVSRLRSKKLVYDSHEYFTEVPELIDRPLTRSIWLRLEKSLFPRLSQAYTVNASIARIYTDTYGIPVSVIRNLPFSRESRNDKKNKVLIYQGALNLARGIELMIDAMPYLEEFELWIVGKGDIEQSLKERAKRIDPLGKQIQFKGFVRPKDLPELTRQAGLGLSLEEDRGLSYHYASPNKVYDYIQSGLPVLVADLPEMKAVVKRYKIGEVLKAEERTASELAKRIKHIFKEPEYDKYQKNTYLAGQELCWEKERENLTQIYKKLI
ncbi:MAG: glycosyltransferase family 4 protein [Bacteroidota bacterium]